MSALLTDSALHRLLEAGRIAIGNARLHRGSESRRRQLDCAVRRLEATTAIARAVGGETDLARILELIAQHGCPLLGTQGLVILLRGPDGALTVAARAGEVPDGDPLGLGGELIPLVFRGQSLGLIVVLGARGQAQDAQLLRAFAASAATAVATARTVEEERLRDALAAAEEERRRWARELHDETLQGLGGLRMLLTAAARSGDPAQLLETARVRIEEEIDGLRGLIRELRPAALDDLGVAAAIEGLATRVAERNGIEVSVDVELERGLGAELETALYRIVQEAVTNAIRHAGAQRVAIEVGEERGAVHLHVRDDGGGFDPGAPRDGFGLIGMRERVALLRGELEIASSATGTTVSAALPIARWPSSERRATAARAGTQARVPAGSPAAGR